MAVPRWHDPRSRANGERVQPTAEALRRPPDPDAAQAPHEAAARLVARLRRVYGRVAPFYDLLDFPFEHGRYGKIRPLVFEEVAGAGRLLDCGAGTGRNISYYPAGCEVVGFDLSAEMLARAGRRARAAGRPVEWVCADATRLPLAAGSVDAAAATFLFCVLPDALQPAALRELRRVVRPGGRLVLLEYVLSGRPVRRWMMRRVWAPWVRVAFGAGFERRTTEHLEATGWSIEQRRFVYADTLLLLVARSP